MMKKVSFGKVDGYGNGRRSCEVEVEFGFREFKGQESYFSAVASVWNNIHSDIIWGGQCVDEISQWSAVRYNPIYKVVREMWKKYHLKNYSEIPNDDRVIIEKLLAEMN